MRTFRGICHVHSTLSDGTLPPEQIAQRAREANFDFIIFCEHAEYIVPHFLDHAIAIVESLTSPDLLTLLGLEVKFEGAHILVIGPHSAMKAAIGSLEEFSLDKLPVEDLLVVWAHPMATFRATAFRHPRIDGWEVWNSFINGYWPDIVTLRSLRKRARGKERPFAIAGSDFHKDGDFFGPVLEVTASEPLSPIGLVRALKGRQFRVYSPKSNLYLHPNGMVQGRTPLTRATLSTVGYAAHRFRCWAALIFDRTLSAIGINH